VSQNARGGTQMQVTYERATSPSTSRRSSAASASSSRKNSWNDPALTRFHTPRHRSPSPSSSRYFPAAASGAAPGASGAGAHQLQRTGSGRYGTAFVYGGAAVQQPNGSGSSPQSNLDSLESYDSGLGLGLSFSSLFFFFIRFYFGFYMW